MSGVVIRSAQLAVAPAALPAMRRLYVEGLGFGGEPDTAERLAVEVGDAQVTFSAAPPGERPFYHFALLVPGDRYRAARRWVEQCARLLSRPGETSTTFRFRAWDADACYFADPAGNVVELIAHRGMGDSSAGDDPFTPRELLGISELGLVVSDPPAAVHSLAGAGLKLWAGTAAGPDALAFVGRQAHTLILCAPGRPWLPTQRPAEAHPVAAIVSADGQTVSVSASDGVVRVSSDG